MVVVIEKSPMIYCHLRKITEYIARWCFSDITQVNTLPDMLNWAIYYNSKVYSTSKSPHVSLSTP